MERFVFYVEFDQLKKASEYVRFAMIGTDRQSTLERALDLGSNPRIVSGPHKLSKYW